MSFLSPAFAPAWSRLTADRIEPDISAALADAQAKFDAIAAQDPAGVSYASMLGAFDEAAATLDRAWTRVQHLDSVCNAPALRNAYNAMLPKVTDFYTRIYLHDGLWKIVQAYATTPEARALTGARRRFLEETLEDFRDSGAGLVQAEKTELERLNTEISSITQKFGENVLDATNAWDLTITAEARLAGLPESARAAARQSYLQKNPAAGNAPGWRFTLHAPSYIPLMKYAQDDALRREVWQASMSLGRTAPHDNTSLIPQILALRQAKARLLGRPQFADLVLHRRMAKSGESALAFIENLHTKLTTVFSREQGELEKFKAMRTGQPVGPLEPWEAAYWVEQRRQTELDFDEEQLRPYFPIEGVLSGLFRLVETLFDVRLTEKPTVYFEPGSDQEPPPGAVEVWHPEVKFYELHDADGRHLVSFFADWHPRESKRGGAWMNFFETGGPRPGGKFAPHLGIIAGNLTAPIPGRPALLTHDEVTTIFHEFGHLLHHLFGEVEVKSLNGVRVAWDFVELPSQIMENWVWERAGLDFVARHYATGQPIAEELFQKMLATRKFMAASAMMRLLAFSKLDLDLHLHAAELPAVAPALEAWLHARLAAYLPHYRTEPPTFAVRFTHVFSEPVGYAAGYYSYKWAEVLEADAFTRFQKEGVLNPATGRDFRRKILARGNGAPPEQLFHDFLGRDPNPDADLARCGLLAG
ncbi:MAG TPA: M3 family metallopeptidase [Opitutales bacterium]|nr:M3 family metallopeptidase [Opitutales bacterium]